MRGTALVKEAILHEEDPPVEMQPPGGLEILHKPLNDPSPVNGWLWMQVISGSHVDRKTPQD